jgi:hypothetical protein
MEEASMRRHLNYANVVATFALVFAMSGGALAAKHYLINSTKQIKPSVLKSLKGNAGKTGKTGATGPIGAPGAAGKEGLAGKEGPAGPFPTGNAPSGVTVRGNYAAGGPASGTSEFFWDSISFGFQFASAPTAHFIKQGATPPAQCPGSATNPQASPGNLCVYESIRIGTYTAEVFDPSRGENGLANRWGGGVILEKFGGAENISSYGTWAATTP